MKHKLFHTPTKRKRYRRKADFSKETSAERFACFEILAVAKMKKSNEAGMLFAFCPLGAMILAYLCTKMPLKQNNCSFVIVCTNLN